MDINLHSKRRRVVIRGLCGCALCLANPPIPARVPPSRLEPLVTPGYKPADTDERGLWHECERLEEALSSSSLLFSDPSLDRYVRSVVERLIGEIAADLRIYVVRNPEFNASMTPNGMMIVHTGLLARMRNEAQLAAVLGHESGHYLRRHSLQNWRRIKNKSAIAAAVALGGTVATGATGSNWYGIANAINNALLLSFFSYSRELESEADAYGLQLMQDGKYRLTAAAEVWGQLIEERKASAAARKKRYRDRSRSAFSTHPPNTERMTDLEQLANELGQADPSASGEDRRSEWRAAIAPIRAMLLDEQIKLNDPGASLYLLKSLARDGWDGTLRFYEGEVYRLRADAADSERAAKAYEAALQFPDAPAEAHRAHGYAQLKAGNVEAGRRALARYLELRPDAPDAEMIRFSLKQ